MNEQRIFQVDGQKWADVTHNVDQVVLSIAGVTAESSDGLTGIELHPEQGRQLGVRLIEEAALADQEAGWIGASRQSESV